MADQRTTTKAEHNQELLRAGYDAFGRGDMETLGELFHPDVVWHAQRLGILGGDHRGWDAVTAFFGQTMQMTEGSFRIEVREILGNDDSAAAVVRSIARRGEATLDSLQIHHFRIRDDRVVEVWQFVADGPAVEAFWS